MNTEKLTMLLRELAPQVADHYSLATYNPDSTQYRLVRDKAVDDGPAVKQFTAGLEEEPELQVFADLMPLRTSPTSGAGLRLFHVARWMLAQARRKDAAEVLTAFAAFLATNAVDALEVMPLWGLHPVREISLDGGIRLVLLADVPPSEPKDMLTGVPLSRYGEKNTFAILPRPKAALVRAFRHGPIFNPAGDGDRQWIEKLPPTQEVQDERMREIARVLTLIRDRAVFPVAHWFQIPEETPLLNIVGGWGGYEQDRRFIEEVAAEDYDAATARTLVGRYLALPDPLRRRLEVALDRLRLALLRVRPEDIALELGIGLEALLTQEQDNEASISYRMRLRATHLLGGDAATRRDNSKRFQILYRLRSRAAHGADVTDKALKRAGGDGPVVDYLREGTVRLGEMLRRVIAAGKFPDWEGLAMGWENPIP